MAGGDDRGGDGGAQRQAAVHGQVGEVQDPEREEHAQDHEAVQEPLLQCALVMIACTVPVTPIVVGAGAACAAPAPAVYRARDGVVASAVIC